MRENPIERNTKYTLEFIINTGIAWSQEHGGKSPVAQALVKVIMEELKKHIDLNLEVPGFVSNWFKPVVEGAVEAQLLVERIQKLAEISKKFAQPTIP